MLNCVFCFYSIVYILICMAPQCAYLCTIWSVLQFWPNLLIVVCLCRFDHYGDTTSKIHKGSSLWLIAMIVTVLLRLGMSCTACWMRYKNFWMLCIFFFSSSLKYFVYIMWVLEFVGWVEGCCATCICQQAGSSKCYECCRDHWQTWSPLSSSTPLVLWWILISPFLCHILAHNKKRAIDFGSDLIQYLLFLQVHSEYMCHFWGRALWGSRLALKQYCKQGMFLLLHCIRGTCARCCETNGCLLLFTLFAGLNGQ